MSEPATHQYANAPLPAHLSVAGWRVGLIVASFSISLPTFLNGAQISLALGFPMAVLAALTAGLLLCLAGSLTSVVAARSRLTTYLLVQRSFGRYGAALVNVVIALVHFGWFGVNVSFFGNAMAAASDQVLGVPGHFGAFVVAGSALMALSTLFGFRTLDRLALVAVPLLGAILVTVCVSAVHAHGIVLEPPATAPVAMSFGIALSALVGGDMLTVTTMPDLARYSRSPRGAVAGMALSFPFSAPLVMVLAALTALATGQTDIMALIVQFGLGVPALVLLVLSTWTLNAANLYSARLSLSATFPRVPPWLFTVFGGAVGAAFALLGIIDAFVPLLLFLALLIPPIAAIYVIDGLSTFGHVDAAESIRDLPLLRWQAVGTWIVSVVAALTASSFELSLTTVPAVDATLLASVIYWTVLRLSRRRHAMPGSGAAA